MPQDILITPNKNSSTTQGKIDFTGKGASASTITLKVLDDSTLSFEGTAGQLFSITPVLASGTIFSVNDISGVPMIDVDASGLVRLAPLGGTVYSNTLYSVTKTVAGAGNSLTLKAGDGLTSGAGGSIVLQPGQQATTGGDGAVIVRQPNGTPGTNELQIFNTGLDTYFRTGTNANGGFYYFQRGDGQTMFYATAGQGGQSRYIVCDNYMAPSYSVTVGDQSKGVNLASGNILGFRNTGYAWTEGYTAGLGFATVGVIQVGRYNSSVSLTNGGSFAYPNSTPTALSASTNDLVLTGSAFQRLSSSAAYNLTGIAPPANGAHVDGRVIWLHNVGSFNITLKHSQTSVAANQFINENGGDIVLGPNRIVQCTYDGTSAKWRVHGEMYPYNMPTTDGTNGQVLSTNGSGTLSWATALTTSNLSGTTNYVAKFTGTNAVGNSIIYDNGTNVGIGTTTLSAGCKLELQTADGGDAFGMSGYKVMKWESSNHLVFGGYTAGQWQILKFFTNGSERLRIDSSGNVGVGNNSPGTALDVIGTGGSTVNAIGTATVRVSPSSQNTYAALELRTLNAGTYGGAGLMAVNDTNYDSNLVFYTNPAGSTTRAERMRIHKNGDIGIAIGGKIAQGLGFAGNASATSYNYIDLYNGTSGELGLRTVGSFPLICYTANTERLRIDSAGNVGVGATSPTSSMTIATNGASPSIYIYKSPDGVLRSAQQVAWLGTGTGTANSGTTGGNEKGYLALYDNGTIRSQLYAYSGGGGVNNFVLDGMSFGQTSAAAGQVVVAPVSASTKGLIVKGAASQSATLQEWQNNGGTALATVDASGNISAASVFTDGGYKSSYTAEYVFYRAAPTTVGNYVEICNFDEQRTAMQIMAVSESGSAIGTTIKIYNFVSAYGTGRNTILTPISMTRQGGYESTFDFEIESWSDGANFRLRLRRTAGTSARNVAIYIKTLNVIGTSALTSATGTGTSSITAAYSYGVVGAYLSVPPVIGGSGAGNSLSLYAGNGETSGAGGSILLQPGLQATTGGNGVVIVRAAGGTAGTDELQIYHDGTNGQIINKDTGGDLKVQLGDSRYFTVARTSNNAYYVSIDPATGISCGNHGFGVTTQNHLDLYAQNSYSIRTRSNIIISDPSWNIDVGINRGGKGVLRITDSSSGGGSIAFTSNTTNISTATNDLALGSSSFQRLNCTVACNLTGVAPPSGGSHVDGRIMRIYNVGTANLTLKHNSTSSTIANRFCCVQAVDIILAPRDYAELIYDGTDGGLVAGQNNPCWRVH